MLVSYGWKHRILFALNPEVFRHPGKPRPAASASAQS